MCWIFVIVVCKKLNIQFSLSVLIMDYNLNEEYESFFQRATGNQPYPYQSNFAKSKNLYQWINVPTGLGKTANIVIGWVWRRFYQEEKSRNATPRRLVYALPMRVIVEQTRDSAILWLNNLGLLSGELELDKINHSKIIKYTPDFTKKGKISVVTLMGGEETIPWDIFPESNMIIVGTQDMLLSRALNRGYGISRYRWPIQFGLLNNDTLWVLDEIQLMGSGLTTSIQLDSHRNYFGMIKEAHSIWMSATLNKQWFYTVDFKGNISDEEILTLSKDDKENIKINKIINSTKMVTASKNNASESYELAIEIIENHKTDSRTIVIVNTVERAKTLFQNIQKLLSKRRNTEHIRVPDILLLHSQFRPVDKEKIIQKIVNDIESNDSIIITTQVIEAGVDISCRTLFTEIAPLQSLVQRFGRCNRSGEYDQSDIFWVDPVDKKGRTMSAPYETIEIEKSRKFLKEIDGKQFSLSGINGFDFEIRNDGSLRRKDILELFDTSPDLTDYDIDISRFVRNSDERHVSVFWRDLDRENLKKENLPERDELCPVPLNELNELLKNSKDERLYKWDWINGGWNMLMKGERLYHGQIVMLDSKKGHYSEVMGWSLKDKNEVPIVAKNQSSGNTRETCSFNDDNPSQFPWKSIYEHTEEVVNKCRDIVKVIGIPQNSKKFEDALLKGALWHDVGKAHPAFQSKINKLEGVPKEIEENQIAKAPYDKWINHPEGGRKYFRHELASALIAIQNGVDPLAIFLALSHHGKIRTSIRSMPGEKIPTDEKIRFAKGVWDGDKIKKVNLPNVTINNVILDLDLMELGSESMKKSWVQTVLNMVKDKEIGIFRLAYLESLLRAADQRASGGL